MTDQRSSRSKLLLDLGRIGVKSLIREPVRDSVREALAEERAEADDQRRATHPPIEEESSEDGNRFLRPAMLLPILGLVAVGAIVRRRSPRTGSTGPSAAAESGESTSIHDTDSDESSRTE